MNILIKFWNWINGKKTQIGVGMLAIATFITEFIMEKWGATGPVWPKIAELLAYIGMALTSSGLLHKGVKGMK